MRTVKDDFTSLKTVTFGDESAVSPNRAASLFQLLQFLQFGLRLLALNIFQFMFLDHLLVNFLLSTLQ